MKNDWSWPIVILLGIITFGIYFIYFWTRLGKDLNRLLPTDSPTMHFCLVFFLLGPITFGIFTLVWMHGVADKLGRTLEARGIDDPMIYPNDFWLWGFFGVLIIVGPLIYISKVCECYNAATRSFNQTGC